MSIEKLYTKPHNKHHLDRYCKFIQRCVEKNSTLELEYFHKHHILPKAKSLFPEYSSFTKNPWNCAVLTYEQHLVAHVILAKAFGACMEFALNRTITSIDKDKNFVYSKEVREKYSTSMKAISDYRKTNFVGSGNPFYGKTHSEEAKRIMSKRAKERDPYTKERKEEISIRMKTNNPFKGKTHSEEAITKMKNASDKQIPVKCPHCDKIGKYSIMTRWHFDNCKMRIQ